MKAKRNIFVYVPGENSVCFGDFLTAGIAYVEDNYKIHRPNSGRTVIEYILQGSGVLEAPDGSYHELNRGDVYYLPRGCDHIYYAQGDVQLAKIYINFGGSFFDDTLARFGIEREYVYRGLDISSQMYAAFDAVREGTPEAEIRCASIVFDIICRMYNHLHSGDGGITDARRIKNYIDKNFSSNIQSHHLAQLVGKSPSQVVRSFKKIYGITPHRYITLKKMEAARVMLRKTELSVREIAQKLSYADEFYFSNAFKKEQGVSPREYRKS